MVASIGAVGPGGVVPERPLRRIVQRQQARWQSNNMHKLMLPNGRSFTGFSTADRDWGLAVDLSGRRTCCLITRQGRQRRSPHFVRYHSALIGIANASVRCVFGDLVSGPVPSRASAGPPALRRAIYWAGIFNCYLFHSYW